MNSRELLWLLTNLPQYTSDSNLANTKKHTEEAVVVTLFGSLLPSLNHKLCITGLLACMRSTL